MKTKELAVYSIQVNMLHVETDNNVCKVLLANGNHLLITCGTSKDAREVQNTLNYYPISGRDNNALEFYFEFELTYEKQ